MARQGTCEERIGGALSDRIGRIGRLLAVEDARDLGDVTDEQLSEVTNFTDPDRSEYEGQRGLDKLNEDARECIEEMPLSVETFKVLKVLLSTGGPADWFEAQIDDDGDILRIEYVYQDWFDGARRTLDGAEFDQAERFIRHFIIE